MPRTVAAASARMSAPPETVYGILADFREGHPAILPRAYFLSLDVEEGGIGAGTVIRVAMRAGPSTRTFRAVVAEPEPGRVLTETDLATGAVTSFTVAPAAGGGSDVTIATTYDAPGLRGWVFRLFAPRLLRRIYREELANLAELSRRRTG